MFEGKVKESDDRCCQHSKVAKDHKMYTGCVYIFFPCRFTSSSQLTLQSRNAVKVETFGQITGPSHGVDSHGNPHTIWWGVFGMRPPQTRTRPDQTRSIGNDPSPCATRDPTCFTLFAYPTILLIILIRGSGPALQAFRSVNGLSSRIQVSGHIPGVPN